MAPSGAICRCVLFSWQLIIEYKMGFPPLGHPVPCATLLTTLQHRAADLSMLLRDQAFVEGKVSAPSMLAIYTIEAALFRAHNPGPIPVTHVHHTTPVRSDKSTGGRCGSRTPLHCTGSPTTTQRGGACWLRNLAGVLQGVNRGTISRFSLKWVSRPRQPPHTRRGAMRHVQLVHPASVFWYSHGARGRREEGSELADSCRVASVGPQSVLARRVLRVAEQAHLLWACWYGTSTAVAAR
jgi:hypothetical protein